MIITLTGENSFGLQNELRRLTGAFLSEHGDLALERIDGQEASLEHISEALTGLPFLAAKKLVVLRVPGANKQFAEQAEQLLGNVADTTDVILVEPKLDKRLTYYKFLKKNTDFREFLELDQNGLARWLGETAKQQGGSINFGDARYLVERVGANQQLLANELEKLLLYSPAITRKSIDELTEAAPQSTIFQLLEAAFAGRSRRALDIYKEQRTLKVEPRQIVAMLAWQLHVLAVIKTAGDRALGEIAKEARINPFVVTKSQGIARSITLAELKKLIADLLKIDTDSKRTSIDIDEALQHYLLTISS
ncbi:DNA polymerase III subunit delta [Candidatus Saccharibacteria bacterium CG_4_10_14_0_2_um_filter_52_9]|nr:MAG: DNA polymerase III subunit delta [Candidatus Saccharibacteria bacterium CG_4_10_14_0_2_um_filter_52_9]